MVLLLTIYKRLSIFSNLSRSQQQFYKYFEHPPALSSYHYIQPISLSISTINQRQTYVEVLQTPNNQEKLTTVTCTEVFHNMQALEGSRKKVTDSPLVGKSQK